MSARWQAIILILILGFSIWLTKAWTGKAEEETDAASAKSAQIDLPGKTRRQNFPLNANVGNAQVFSQGLISTTTVSALSCSEAVLAQAAKAEFLLTGRSRFDLNSDKSWPTASLIKLLTASVIAENFDLSQEIILSEKAISSEGTAGGFKAGEIFSGNDLLKAALLLSSNDAVEALLDGYGRQQTETLIKEKANEIALYRTQIFEPTGLSWRNQSTADDILTLISYVYSYHPEILAITREKSAQITELKSGQKRLIYNINKFAGQKNFIGGKTGYIDEAKGNLASIFEIGGQPAAIVILGATDRFGETEKILKCISPTAF